MINFEKNLNQVESVAEGKRLTTGGYICKIIGVQNLPDKKYLKIQFDIVEGEFKGYFKNQIEKLGYTTINIFRSYQEKALPFFKMFLNQIEITNKMRFEMGSTFDEKSLINKFIGVVICEEEYMNNKENKIKTRLTVQEIKTGQEIREGKFKVNELKKKEQSTVIDSGMSEIVGDEDIPF